MSLESKGVEKKESMEHIKSSKAFIFTVSPQGIFMLIPQHNFAVLPSTKLSRKGIRSLPGGKIEEKETPYKSLIRELDEELGLKTGYIIHIKEGPKITTSDENKTIDYAMFFTIVPDFWAPNFENDPDKEYNGYLKLPLVIRNKENISGEELQQAINKALSQISHEIFFAPYINMTPMNEIKKNIKNSLLSALSNISIPPDILNKIIHLQDTLFTIRNFSLKGAEKISLAEHPIDIFVPQSTADNFTLVIDIEKALEKGLDYIKELFVISSHIFMQAKAKGVLTNQHVIKFPREKWNLLDKHQQQEIINIITNFCQLRIEKGYIKSCFIPKLEKNANSKRIVLIEHGERLAQQEEIEQLHFPEKFFEEPVIFPPHKHSLPLFKGSEKNWKNILKELINTYYPETETTRHLFQGTFIDFPRLPELKQRTLSEILNVFFGIYEDTPENFETLGSLFSKALEFYRYFLGSKVPDNFINNTRWFNSDNSTFHFKNLKDFQEFLNRGTGEIKVFKWTLFKIAYVINYYITHIQPKLSQSTQIINLITEKIKKIIGDRPVPIREKSSRSSILKLLRRGDTSERSFKDLIGAQIHLGSNDDPQQIVESLIYELLDLFDNLPSQGAFEIEIKGNVKGFNSNFFDKSIGVSKIKDTNNSPFNAITIQFKIDEVPIEIMIFLPQQHQQSEKGLSTHPLYDLIKVLETLTRLFGWLPQNKVHTIIKTYTKQNPMTSYGTNLISEIYASDTKKFLEDLQKAEVQTAANLPNTEIFSQQSRQELLNDPKIDTFLNELSHQLLESFKDNGKIQALKRIGSDIVLSFGFTCKEMEEWYTLLMGSKNAANTGDCYDNLSKNN